MKKVILLALFGLTGCFQTYNEDDNLRTVPITNNPHVVPSHGNGLPMGGSSAGPY